AAPGDRRDLRPAALTSHGSFRRPEPRHAPRVDTRGSIEVGAFAPEPSALCPPHPVEEALAMSSRERLSPIRRPLTRRILVAASTGALVLGVVGAAGPAAAGAAGRPATDTRVAGIDVDATTIPQLQTLMNAHRLNSVQLVTFYLHRIR